MFQDTYNLNSMSVADAAVHWGWGPLGPNMLPWNVFSMK